MKKFLKHLKVAFVSSWLLLLLFATIAGIVGAIYNLIWNLW